MGDRLETERRRRFSEELAQIPVVDHPIYGTCLMAPRFLPGPPLPREPTARIGAGERRAIGAGERRAGGARDRRAGGARGRARADRARSRGRTGRRPRNLSPRISAQQAVFVFGQVVQEPWGSLRLAEGAVSLGGSGAIPGAAVSFVSAQLKRALAGLWQPRLGFSEESLFPDFDGFAQAHRVDQTFPPAVNDFAGSDQLGDDSPRARDTGVGIVARCLHRQPSPPERLTPPGDVGDDDGERAEP